MNISTVEGKLQFIYTTDEYDVSREKVVINLTNLARKYLELPYSIEVEFAKLADSSHADTLLNPRFQNRVRLQRTLSSKEVIIPYLHELIHVNQIHKKILVPYRNLVVSWKGKVYNLDKQLSYSEYQSLPWEADVTNRLPSLVSNILHSAGLK